MIHSSKYTHKQTINKVVARRLWSEIQELVEVRFKKNSGLFGGMMKISLNWHKNDRHGLT